MPEASLLSSIGSYRFRGAELLVPELRAATDLIRPLDKSELNTISDPVLESNENPASITVPLTDGSAVFNLRQEPADRPPENGWRPVALRTVWMAANLGPTELSNDQSKLWTEAFLRACHINRWLNESHYCGRCGSANTLAADEFAQLCPLCGRREYPRIIPAVIVLIENQGRLLLAHNRKFSAGVYSLIAGFVEAGESLEAAVRREVAEEVGIRLTNIQYSTSQPWPFSSSLMVAFKACHSDGIVQPDGIEITDAAWFEPNNLPALPMPGSVARALIEAWLSEYRANSWKV